MRGEAVDCIPSLLTNGRPAPILSELTTTAGVRILPIPDDVMMKAKALNPGISIGMIPGGKVPGIDQETGADSFPGVLAAVPDLDPKVGYTVMQAIFDHEEAVRSLGVQFGAYRPDFGANYLDVGFPSNT